MSADETVTFTLPARHALVRHLEDLQRTLTKRNAEIEALKQRLDGEGESEQMQRARNEGFKRGWQTALHGTHEAMAEVETAARRLRNDAFKVYLAGPKETEPRPCIACEDDALAERPNVTSVPATKSQYIRTNPDATFSVPVVDVDSTGDSA
jgi:hypothetical protein